MAAGHVSENPLYGVLTHQCVLIQHTETLSIYNVYRFLIMFIILLNLSEYLAAAIYPTS